MDPVPRTLPRLDRCVGALRRRYCFGLSTLTRGRLVYFMSNMLHASVFLLQRPILASLSSPNDYETYLERVLHYWWGGGAVGAVACGLLFDLKGGQVSSAVALLCMLLGACLLGVASPCTTLSCDRPWIINSPGTWCTVGCLLAAAGAGGAIPLAAMLTKSPQEVGRNAGAVARQAVTKAVEYLGVLFMAQLAEFLFQLKSQHGATTVSLRFMWITFHAFNAVFAAWLLWETLCAREPHYAKSVSMDAFREVFQFFSVHVPLLVILVITCALDMSYFGNRLAYDAFNRRAHHDRLACITPQLFERVLAVLLYCPGVVVALMMALHADMRWLQAVGLGASAVLAYVSIGSAPEKCDHSDRPFFLLTLIYTSMMQIPRFTLFIITAEDESLQLLRMHGLYMGLAVSGGRLSIMIYDHLFHQSLDNCDIPRLLAPAPPSFPPPIANATLLSQSSKPPKLSACLMGGFEAHWSKDLMKPTFFILLIGTGFSVWFIFRVNVLRAYNGYVQESNTYMAERVVAAIEAAIDMNDVLIPWEHVTKLHKVGVGSKGKVFRAKYSGQDVALKQHLGVLSDGDTDMTSLIRESQMFSRLKHPHIIGFYGITKQESEAQGTVALGASPFSSPVKRPSSTNWYIVTEFCHHGNLREAQLRHRFDQVALLEFAIQIGEAMVFLHHRGIVHRDLRPEKIMMASNNSLKICDLESSRKAVHDLASSGISERVPQALYYTPPEVLRDGKGKYEGKTWDVYSAGVLFAFMFSEEDPFSGEEFSAVDLICKAQNMQPVRAQLSDSIPGQMRDLITSMWAENPSERPTFTDVLNKLKAMHSSNTFSGDGLMFTELLADYNSNRTSPETPR
ncbi:hypothetical protein CYMTET_50206 [Cymbomonas tetramitiformis]|uniref:Protein kinase domain-containing protein n=1 Tax=Cymbomonas tetramitiformis TaxID=36881 RepID=A0AAE0BPW1_9CHLO|nr:hypothetical protein CYMTET_50206 [Cymbomonas tetramitiformis]